MAVNAIDFSDLTKKPEIDSKTGLWKEPQPQQNQQMGIKNTETGEVQPAMGYPVNEMGQGDELLQLFPVPILICPYPNDYSKELEWIRNAETRKENKGEQSGNGLANSEEGIHNDQLVDMLMIFHHPCYL